MYLPAQPVCRSWKFPQTQLSIVLSAGQSDRHEAYVNLYRDLQTLGWNGWASAVKSWVEGAQSVTILRGKTLCDAVTGTVNLSVTVKIKVKASK